MTSFGKVLLYILALFSSGTSSENSFLTNHLLERVPKENGLAHCLASIVRDSSLSYMKNIQTRIETESEIFRQEFLDTVESFYALNDEVLIELYSKERLPYNIHCRFFFIDSLKSLELLISSQRVQDDDFSGERQHYFITLPRDVSSPIRLLEQIFHLCFRSSIINVNVLIEDGNEVVTLYTYYPFNERNCEDHTPVVHNRFVNGTFESNNQTFPTKTNNLWQCPIRLISWHEPPFLFVNQNQLSGFDVNIARILSEVMNFSLEFVMSAGGRGVVSLNKIPTGGFKMMRDGLGDLMIGDSTCTMTRKQFFAATVSYHTSYSHILVKIESYSPLELLCFPFDNFTWIALLIVITAKWISQLLWRRFSRNDFDSRSEYGSRIFRTSWLFSILIVCSSYEGSIFNYLHNRPSKVPPHGLEEAIQQGYEFIATPFAYMLLSSIHELKNKMISLNGSEIENLDYFERLEGRYALISLLEYISYYNDISPGPLNNFVVRKPIVAYVDCMYLPKYSYLTVALNKYLEMMITHGHIHKFEEIFLLTDTYGKKKLIGKEPMKASLHHLSGAFQLLGILMGISACVFGMELLAKYNRGLRMVVEVFE